jgi:hypothetical protein
MRQLWEEWDAGFYRKVRKNPILVVKNLAELVSTALLSGAAAPLGLALLFGIAFARTRKTAVLLIILTIFAAGLCLEIFLLLHYLAPAVPVVLLLAMQGIRALRLVSVGRLRPGLRLTVLVMVASVGIAALQVIDNRQTGTSLKSLSVLDARWNIESKLEAQPGQHVVVVRYSPDHNMHQEIVYNGPDIDAQRIVWAIDRGAVENRRLVEYYRGRHVWLLQPDPPNVTLAPYSSK